MNKVIPLKADEICKAYAIYSEPADNGRGFVGLYEIPGKDVQYARKDDGAVEIFDTEEDAIASAGQDLCKAMNARTRSSTNDHGHHLMGGADLAVALKELQMSPTKFAEMVGTEPRRVLDWIDGKLPITRPVNLLVRLLAFPCAKDRAQEIIDEIAYVKRGPHRATA